MHSAILIKVKPALRSGDMIDGKYAIVSTISEGGWGSVYRARREDMERDVAIKVLHERLSVDANASKRFCAKPRRSTSFVIPADPGSTSTFWDVTTLRFSSAPEPNTLVFPFDRAPFYKHAEDKVPITMVRSSEYANWVIDSIAPASQEQWDQL